MFRMLVRVIVLLGAMCAVSGAEDLFAGAPPMPKGYATYEEARDALRSGEVARVELPEAVPDAIRFYDDVVYATHDGVTLTLDIFVPKEAETPRPLLLFIHGGGWSAGKKEHFLAYTLAFAELGYVTASMQYRLTPKHVFPANVQDVKCAIVFLREHASEYRIDPATVVTMGDSAGGHLALLAGYAQDPALGCPEGGGDSSVQAVVNLYGVVDCTTPVAIQAHQVIDYMGASYDEAKASYEAASPLLHLDPNDPPTLTFHGVIDELVPIAQADKLHAKLKELGIDNYYDRMEGWPHALDTVEPFFARCRYVTQRFLEKYAPIEK